VSGSIGAAHIGSGAIREFNIGDQSIFSGAVSPSSIGTIHLASGTIPAGSLASGSVGSGYLGDGSVVSGSVASGQIGNSHFASGANAAIIQLPALGMISGGRPVTYRATTGTVTINSGLSVTSWVTSGYVNYFGYVPDNFASGDLATVYMYGITPFGVVPPTLSGLPGSTFLAGISVISGGFLGSGGTVTLGAKIASGHFYQYPAPKQI
jgi:hypothetical protein